jgi:hypothetical protein
MGGDLLPKITWRLSQIQDHHLPWGQVFLLDHIDDVDMSPVIQGGQELQAAGSSVQEFHLGRKCVSILQEF